MLSQNAGNVLGLISLDALPPGLPIASTLTPANAADDATLEQTLARLAGSTVPGGKDCRVCRMKGLVAKTRRSAMAEEPSRIVASTSEEIAANVERLAAELEMATTAAVQRITAGNTAN